MVIVGYPLDKTENHVYIDRRNTFLQRCDTDIEKEAEQVVELSEDEFRELISDSSYDFCPNCLQYMQGIQVPQ